MCFKNLDDLYKHLSNKYGLIKYKDRTENELRRMEEPYYQKKYTEAYYFFSYNIWRTLATYNMLREGLKSLGSKRILNGPFEYLAPYETIMILMITQFIDKRISYV